VEKEQRVKKQSWKEKEQRRNNKKPKGRRK
jgi:hypothetical protein